MWHLYFFCSWVSSWDFLGFYLSISFLATALHCFWVMQEKKLLCYSKLWIFPFVLHQGLFLLNVAVTFSLAKFILPSNILEWFIASGLGISTATGKSMNALGFCQIRSQNYIDYMDLFTPLRSHLIFQILDILCIWILCICHELISFWRVLCNSIDKSVQPLCGLLLTKPWFCIRDCCSC